MNQYYLMAQLPSPDTLSESNPLPITAERFYELCNRLLDKRALETLNALTLAPKPDFNPTGNKLVDKWNQHESKLRLALAVVRAEKMNKAFQTEASAIPTELSKAAQTATDMTDPMAAELFLSRFRLAFLESLRPTDYFSESSVYYYGLRLMLTTRIKSFDSARGEQEYRSIYNSILNEEKQEKV